MNRRQIVLWSLVITWMVIIFEFSHQGHEVSSGQSGAVVDSIGRLTGVFLTETLIRKSAHALVYGVLAMLLLLAVRSHGVGLRHATVVSVSGVLVYAISDEAHQLLVPGRSGRVSDVLLDTAAGVIGIYLYVAILKYCIKDKNNV